MVSTISTREKVHLKIYIYIDIIYGKEKEKHPDTNHQVLGSSRFFSGERFFPKDFAVGVLNAFLVCPPCLECCVCLLRISVTVWGLRRCNFCSPNNWGVFMILQPGEDDSESIH